MLNISKEFSSFFEGLGITKKEDLLLFYEKNLAEFDFISDDFKYQINIVKNDEDPRNHFFLAKCLDCDRENIYFDLNEDDEPACSICGYFSELTPFFQCSDKELLFEFFTDICDNYYKNEKTELFIHILANMITKNYELKDYKHAMDGFIDDLILDEV